MAKAKHTDVDAPFLDDDERAIVEAAEGGEFAPEQNLQLRIELWQQAAASTSKKKPVTVRLQERDIQRIKSIAHRRGIPYQTLVSSIIHQYAAGTLKESE